MARRETGLFRNALAARVSKRMLASAAAVRALWRVLRDAPPAAPLLRTEVVACLAMRLSMSGQRRRGLTA